MARWSSKLLYSILILNFLIVGTVLIDTNVSSKSVLFVADSEEDFEAVDNWDGEEQFSFTTERAEIFDSYLTPDYDIIGNYGWEPEEVIDPNNPMNDIKVALDVEDNVHIFWSGRYNTEWVLYHNIKNNLTGIWSAKTIIGDTASEYYGLMDVETDSAGNIHIAWVDDTQVKYRKYSNGTWGSTSLVGYGENPKLELTNESQPRITYFSISSLYTIDYFYAIYNNESNTWHRISIVNWQSYSAISSTFDFHIFYEDGFERSLFFLGTVYSIWHSYYNRDYYIDYELYWKANETAPFEHTGFLRTYEIPSSQYYIAKPKILTMEDKSLHIIYSVATGEDEYTLMYQKLTHEYTWSPVALTTKVAQNCFMDAILDSHGRMTLLWNWVQYIGGTTAGLYLKALSPNTGGWSADVLLNPGHGYSQYPDFAVDSDGNVHMAWVDQVDNIRTIYYRKGWNDADEDGLMNYEERGIYGTNPDDSDTDDDQMLDGEEISLGFDPFNPDEDSDGMLDGYELHYGLDPYTNDSLGDLDGDLLLNIDEFLASTYPNDNDSDDDFVSDYDEVVVHMSNPLNTDTDNDMLDDGLEINDLGSDPNSNDTDGDIMSDYYEFSYQLYLDINVNDSMLDPDGEGLINLYEYYWSTSPGTVDFDADGLDDYQEVIVWGTHPRVRDTDKDNIWDGEEVYTYGTNPLKQDTDDDYLLDWTEITNGIDPLDNDTDDDLMLDGYEFYFGLNPLDASDANVDLDGDTLTNYQEFLLWTHPNKTDTDGDKFWDNVELIYGSDPTLYDTDGDGLNDYDEIIVLGTNVTNPDTDYDGLNDYLEVHIYGSNPHIIDSDGDTLIDGEEVYIYNTHPADRDTDNDLVEDNVELDYGSDPTVVDTDFDGMDDYFEWLYGLDSQIDDSGLDNDNDNITNGEEFIHNSNPLVIDSDLDGLTDWEEIAKYYTLADNPDTDGDGLSDWEEINPGVDGYRTLPHDPDTDDDRILDGDEVFLYGTNVTNADSDGDGIDDGQELLDNTDPWDPEDNMNNTIMRYILIIFGSIIGVILIYYIAPFFISKLAREEEVKWVREGILWRRKKSDKMLNSNNDSIETQES